MPGDTFLLDSFTVSVRDIDSVDVNLLLALSVNVGWPHRAEDWQFMREVGRGLAVVDEADRVHGSAMWFPCGDDFATIGMVITTSRLQTYGGAQWLMNQMLEQTADRVLGLHATTQSHRLFLSLGFADEQIVYLRQGHAGAPPEVPSAPDAKIRTLSATDLPGIRELDRAATRLDRHGLVEALLARSTGVGLIRQGTLQACAFVRPFGRGSVIGPVFAANEADAVRVIRPLILERAGEFLRIDIDRASGRLADFLEQSGLPVRDRVTRMSRGRPWPFSTAGAALQFALTSHATG